MFLKNAWYAAIWAKDLSTTPVARTILNEPVAFYRTADGKPAALADRCCHRAAPLSRGALNGELLQCGYHGLQFDTTGKCVDAPAQKHESPGSRVRSYPVHDRWNTVWIWMGDAKDADPATIPDLHWLDDPAWCATPGYLRLNANYQLLVDNLLDFTHVSYLHRTTLAGDVRERSLPMKTERSPDGVRASRWILAGSPPPLFQKVGKFEGLVDRWQYATWNPPSLVYLDVGCAKAGTGAPEGDRSQGISLYSNHLITPETETSTHYLFSYARNFEIDDPEVSKLLFEGSSEAFNEDSAMLEAQQRNLDGGILEGLINITSDANQLRARRILEELIRSEQRLVAT